MTPEVNTTFGEGLLAGLAIGAIAAGFLVAIIAKILGSEAIAGARLLGKYEGIGERNREAIAAGVAQYVVNRTTGEVYFRWVAANTPSPPAGESEKQ